MLIKDVMTSPVVCVTETDLLSDAITLMVVHKISGLPVLDSAGQLVGILSEGDLLRRVELGSGSDEGSWWSRLLSSRELAEHYRRSNGRQVSDVMTAQPITIGETATLSDAAGLMQKHRVKRLPVLRDGVVVGLLTRMDFVRLLGQLVAPAYEEAAISDDEVKSRIRAEIAHQSWSRNCDVEITVAQGRVTLDGLVPSEVHRESVRVAADNVPGVLSVDDRLRLLEPVCIPGF